MATDFVSSSFLFYSVFFFFVCVCLACVRHYGILFLDCRFFCLSLRSVKHRLPKSPHATMNSSHPCLSFSYISLLSNQPDRLIIFLLLPKFHRFPSPSSLQLLIFLSCLSKPFNCLCRSSVSKVLDLAAWTKMYNSVLRNMETAAISQEILKFVGPRDGGYRRVLCLKCRH